jgi:hypothetical protein
MPLSDRDYIRGKHPPSCTCNICCIRRIGKRNVERILETMRDTDTKPPITNHASNNIHKGNPGTFMKTLKKLWWFFIGLIPYIVLGIAVEYYININFGLPQFTTSNSYNPIDVIKWSFINMFHPRQVIAMLSTLGIWAMWYYSCKLLKRLFIEGVF